MLKYSWNEEKNNLLKKTRGIDFEQISQAFENDKIIVVLPHPNPQKYKNQKMVIVNVNNYAYCVPIIQQGNKIFLKTIYASRKYTKKYIKEVK